MRPVNLIPPEDRRGDKAPLRSGPLSYIVIGALAVVLLAVYMMVSTSNNISEKEGQVAQLESDLEAATAQAESLTPYTEFASLRADREATISSLAQSRFDWERVMREMAYIIPEDVTLTNLNGSAFSNADGSAATEEIGAPNFTVSGCSASHEATARFTAALQDIDGVTRVGLARSEEVLRGESSATSAICGDANTFDITVTFDNATVSPETAEAAAAAPLPAENEIEPEDPSTAAENSSEEQTKKAKDAASIPGAVTP